MQPEETKITNKFPRLFVIGGPTASGKSRLAEAISEKLGFPIISADSRQVFKQMDLGTAKPLPHDLIRYRYYGINLIEPSQKFDVWDFGQYVSELLNGPLRHEKGVILVGGTGLYIKTILYGLNAPSTENAPLRFSLELGWKNSGLAWLQQQVPNEIFSSLNPSEQKNPLRLIRKIEIASTPHLEANHSELPAWIENCDTMIVHLLPARSLLYDQINNRVEAMIKNGLVNEVESLRQIENPQVWNTVGYKEFKEVDFDFQKLNLIIEKIKQHTRNYAKRQYTWFRQHKADLIITEPDEIQALSAWQKKFN